MAVLKVRRYGDPVLRRRATAVETMTPETRRLADDMIDTMYDEVGIGLAAPQVGASVRLLVVGDEEGRGAQALVNPTITAQGGQVTAEEGCLSLPGIFEKIARAEWVKVRALDLDGKSFTTQATGLLSVCIQHEMDHLKGKIFIEYLSRLKQTRILSKLKKQQRQTL